MFYYVLVLVTCLPKDNEPQLQRVLSSQASLRTKYQPRICLKSESRFKHKIPTQDGNVKMDLNLQQESLGYIYQPREIW